MLRLVKLALFVFLLNVLFAGAASASVPTRGDALGR